MDILDSQILLPGNVLFFENGLLPVQPVEVDLAVCRISKVCQPDRDSAHCNEVEKRRLWLEAKVVAHLLLGSVEALKRRVGSEGASHGVSLGCKLRISLANWCSLRARHSEMGRETVIEIKVPATPKKNDFESSL